MEVKRYELIIFDLDGTFYSLDDVVSEYYKLQVRFYSEQKQLSPAEVEEIFSQNNIFPYKSEQSRSATEFFIRNGLDAGLWNKYRNDFSPVQKINRDTSVSGELIGKFADYSSLVLLSSNTIENIRATLAWLGVDESLFNGIYCSSNTTTGERFSKKTVVPVILEKLSVAPEKALAVGDRYESDIRPLQSIGGDGVLVNGPAALEELCADLYSGTLISKPGVYTFFEN